MDNAPQPRDDEPLDFEAALAQLETIIGQLESGKLSLEAALTQYEAGVRLIQKCRQALQAAEERLVTIEALQRAEKNV